MNFLKKALLLTSIILTLLFFYFSNFQTFYYSQVKWIFRFSSEEINVVFISEMRSRYTNNIVFIISRRSGKQYLYLISLETGALIRAIDLKEDSQVNFLCVNRFLHRDISQLLVVCSSKWILLDLNGSKLTETKFFELRNVLEIGDYDNDGIKEILYYVFSSNVCNIYIGKYLLNRSEITFAFKQLCSLEGKVVFGALRGNRITLLSDLGHLIEFREDSSFKHLISEEDIVLINIKDVDCDLKEEIIICKCDGTVEALEMTRFGKKWKLKFPTKTLLMQSIRFTSDDESTYGLLHGTGGSLHYTCCMILLKSDDGNLYAISGNNGEIIWSYKTCKAEKVIIDTSDYNLDGTPDIILGIEENICILDGRYGFLLKKIDLNKKILFLKTCDVDNDKKIEVIVGTCSEIFALKLS